MNNSINNTVQKIENIIYDMIHLFEKKTLNANFVIDNTEEIKKFVTEENERLSSKVKGFTRKLHHFKFSPDRWRRNKFKIF